MTRRYDVCVSYCEADTAFAERLREDLRAKGLTTWGIRWHAVSGSSLTTIIEQGSRLAAATVLVMSPDHCGPVRPPWARAEERQETPRVVLVLRRDCDLREELPGVPSVDFRDGSSYEAALSALVAVLAPHIDERVPPSANTGTLSQHLSFAAWAVLMGITVLLGADWFLAPSLAVVASTVAIALVQLGSGLRWRARVVGAATFGLGTPLVMGTYAVVYDDGWLEAAVAAAAFMIPIAACVSLLFIAGRRLDQPWVRAFLAGAAVLIVHPVAWASMFAASCTVFGCF